MKRTRYWCPKNCGKSIHFDNKKFVCERCSFTAIDKTELLKLQREAGLI